jgi:hypothetical protein
MKTFNVGETQVYEILKKEAEVLKWWEHCANKNKKRAYENCRRRR